jgi:hypothetical protein
MLKSLKSAAEYALGIIGLAMCLYAGYALTLIVGGVR